MKTTALTPVCIHRKRISEIIVQGFLTVSNALAVTQPTVSKASFYLGTGCLNLESGRKSCCCFSSVRYLLTMMSYNPSPLLHVPSHLCCIPDVHIPDFHIFIYIVYPCFWLPTSTCTAPRKSVSYYPSVYNIYLAFGSLLPFVRYVAVD